MSISKLTEKSFINTSLLLQRLIIINIDIPVFIIMKPNPYTWKSSLEKVYTMDQTLGGWITEHWGNKPEEIKCSGITKTKYGTIKNNINSHIEGEGMLLLLKQIYMMDKEKLVSVWGQMDNKKKIISESTIDKIVSTRKDIDLMRLARTYIWYKGTVYTGFFTDFDYEEKAEMPRNYFYNFTFISLSNTTDQLMSKVIMNSINKVFGNSISAISNIITKG